MAKIAVVYVDASVDTEKKLSGLAVLGLIQQKGGGKFHATLSVPADDSTLAEALAVKAALELVLIALGPRAKVTIVSDHQSVVEQLRQKARNRRSDLDEVLRAIARLRGLIEVSFKHRKRLSSPEMEWVDKKARESLEWARMGGPITIAPSRPEGRMRRKRGLLAAFRRLVARIFGAKS